METEEFDVGTGFTFANDSLLSSYTFVSWICRLKFLTHFGDLSSLFVKWRVDLENNGLEAVLLGRSDLLNNVTTSCKSLETEFSNYSF